MRRRKKGGGRGTLICVRCVAGGVSQDVLKDTFYPSIKEISVEAISGRISVGQNETLCSLFIKHKNMRRKRGIDMKRREKGVLAG